MLDPKTIRSEPEKIKEALMSRRADPALVDAFLEIDKKWRSSTFKIEELKKQRNENSKKVGEIKKSGGNADDMMRDTKVIGDQIQELETEAKVFEEDSRTQSLFIPNIPHSTVPKGKSEADNEEIRKWGEISQFSFIPKPHNEIGINLGLLDFDRAAKISGSRFVVYKGLGAALERALISFMLDTHTKENGYVEVMTPVMVNENSMVGTGQLPKFKDEMFKCADDPYYLIPTAEVPVTNLHRDEILPIVNLPIKYCSYSPCFRREAGSYGKDVKGIIRQHQFNKVELVKFVEPQNSYDEHEKLTRDAEAILQKLNLPYRVVLLCTADLGFSSAKTYDLEVWFPSENRYREISSCSNFEDFQARRAGIRYRNKENKIEFVHTINGSGLAVGRTLAAVFENYQQADGSIIIPEVLKKYL